MKQVSGRRDGTPGFDVAPDVMTQHNSRGDFSGDTDAGGGEFPVSNDDHVCFATKSGTQSIPNATGTFVAYDTELYDTDNYHDAVGTPAEMNVPAGELDAFICWSFTELEAWQTPVDRKIGGNVSWEDPTDLPGRITRQDRATNPTRVGYTQGITLFGHQRPNFYVDPTPSKTVIFHSFGGPKNVTAKCRMFWMRITDNL